MRIIRLGPNLVILRPLQYNGWHAIRFIRDSLTAYGYLPDTQESTLRQVEITTRALWEDAFNNPEITAGQFIVSFWQDAFSASFLAGFVCMRFNMPIEAVVALVHSLPRVYRN